MSERIGILTDMISEAESGYSWYEKTFSKMLDAYFLRMDTDQYKWLEDRAKSRLYFPKINAKGKRITDSLNETYFNNDKFANLETYINSSQNQIEAWQEAIDHYTEMMNLYKTFSPIFQKIPYLGTSVVKVYWSDDLCKIDEIPLSDISFDPYAETSDDVRYIVNKIRMTKGDMLKLQKDGVFTTKENLNELLNESKPYERFELDEIYYITPNGWEVATVYDDSVVLRDKHKVKDGQPFKWGYMLPQIKDINEDTYVCCYGEPPLASMLPLQDEMNTARNTLIDATKQLIAPKLIIPKSAGISRVDIETPSKPIFTQNPSGVGQVPPPNIQGLQVNMQMIENESSEVTGVSPQQNGISPQRKETATQASIMANEGSVRLQGYIRTYNETFFEPIFERVAMLVWKYADPSFFVGIDRTEIPSFKVSLNTGIGALNKEVQKEGLLQAHSMVGQQLQAHMALQDMEGAKQMLEASGKIIREVLPLFGVKNVDEFLGEENAIRRNINGINGGENEQTIPNEGAVQ